MRIAMVTSSYPKFKGDTTAPFIEALATNIGALGHEIHVIAPYHPDLRRAPQEDGVYFHFYRYAPTRGLNVWGYAASLEADVRVKRAIYLLIPFVFLSSLATLLRLTAQQPFDVIHAHWVIPNGPMAALAARLRGLPLVVTLHGSDIFVAERNLLLGTAARFTFDAAGVVTACSHDLERRALRLGATASRMVVVPWGVDTHAFSSDPLVGQALRRELGFGDDEMMVFAAGRLVYKKGFDYLLRAAPMVLERKPRTRFVIAGDGDLAGELQSLAASLGVGERVHFAGSVSREQIGAYFSACDVFVVPSVQDREGNVDGLPTVLMEAMAAAKPIVATRVAGIPLVMTDGENGLLVEEKDPAQLAEAVTRLLASPELRARMGQAGERRVRDELNWRHIADIFVELYRQAITRRCPERSG